MNFKRLLFASAFLCVPVLFAGSNPKATGTFTYISNVNNQTATIALSAQQLDTSFAGKGTLFVQDGAGTLILDVKYVHVEGNIAYIASQVAEGSNYVGQPVGNWYVNMVVDVSEPGVGHDFIRGAGLGPDSNTNAAKAMDWVANPTDAVWQTADLFITSGNIQVHQ